MTTAICTKQSKQNPKAEECIEKIALPYPTYDLFEVLLQSFISKHLRLMLDPWNQGKVCIGKYDVAEVPQFSVLI